MPAAEVATCRGGSRNDDGMPDDDSESLEPPTGTSQEGLVVPQLLIGATTEALANNGYNLEQGLSFSGSGGSNKIRQHKRSSLADE